jgi:hypothetical protein
VKPIEFTQIETTAVLRHLRAARDGINKDIATLQDKVAHGADGPTRGAILALDAERSLLENAIAKLWISVP